MEDNKDDLKKQKQGWGSNPNNKWTLENIEAGFERFYEEHGHYPSASEVDRFSYLPSARQIQRAFKGMKELRKHLKLRHEAPDHNSGRVRSDIAGMAMSRAAEYEEKFFLKLIKLIPELYVHEHKVIRFNGYKTQSDYFIFYPNAQSGFVVDLFFADYMPNLLKQVNIKLPKYIHVPFKTYFISVNENILQDDIDQRLQNKVTPLPNHIHVVTSETFFETILPQVQAMFLKN